MIKVNGVDKNFTQGQNLHEFLEAEGYDQRMIVIGLNDDIVHKGTYEEVVLKDGDVVEVLRFVSGG